MKPRVEVLNNIYRLLGMKVIHGTAMLRDGSFIEEYTYNENGFPRPLPDFWNDMRETVRSLPRDVQFHLRWSAHAEQWACLLMRGTEIYEGFGATEGEAAARAFEQLLIAQAVMA